MSLKNFFSLKSHREQDYNRLSSRLKIWYFELKRGHLLSHSIDRLKWYLAPKFFFVIPFPTHIDIEAAVSCQMRCPMCLRAQMPEGLKNGIMDFELYKKIIDECSMRGVYSIKLSWRGESLLNSRITDMIKYAKDSGIKDVALLSNGERLTPELSSNLVGSGLDWISFSVDGFDETYEKIRYPSKFKDIVIKIKYLKEIRIEKGLKKPLIRVQTIFAAIKENPSRYFDFWNPIADKVYVIADQVRGDVVAFERNPHYICLEPWRRITIGWNGIVPQCICDYEEQNILGDVRTQSIHKIWHGEKFDLVRQNIRIGNLMQNKPCTICHDPGEMVEKIINIKDKQITLMLYKGQEIDLSKLDSRPLKLKNKEKS